MKNVKPLCLAIFICLPFISCEDYNETPENTAPVASFTVDPTEGTTETPFRFNPSSSSDPESAAVNLLCRWDWESDGNWDTEYGSLEVETHQYSSEGNFEVTLEVKDPEGLSHQAKKNLTVTDSESSSSTELIGQNGGKIEVSGAEIIIAEGTFSQEIELTLKSTNEDHTLFEPADNALVFSLEGIPASINQPIEIKLDISEIESEEDYAIIVGREGFIKSMDESLVGSFSLPTEKNDQVLIGILHPEDLLPVLTPLKSGSNQGKFWFSFIGTSASYTSNLFEISWDRRHNANQTLITDLEKHLSKAHGIIQNDFGMSWSKRTKWPMTIDVKKMDNSYDGGMTMPWYSSNPNSYFIQFNTFILDKPDVLKSTAIHELFHINQELYNSTQSKTHYWFDEASATWCQDFLEDGSASGSQNSLRQKQPFYGIQNIAESGYREHGYGMAYLVKYLADKLGNTVIRDIYQDIDRGVHVVQSIFNQFGSSHPRWFNEFIQKYLQGELYGELSNEFDKLDYPIEISMSTEGDSVYQKSENVHDLGCDLFKLPLDYDYEESAYLDFKLTGLAGLGELMIFKYKIGGGQYLQLIVDDVREYSLHNLKELKEQGYTLMIAIPNTRAIAPYTGSIDYTFQVSRKNEFLDLSHVKTVGYGFLNTEYHYVGYKDSVEISGVEEFMPNILPQGWSGTFKNGVFNETKDIYSNSGTSTCRIYVDTLNMQIDSLISEGSWNRTPPSYSAGTYKLILRDIPFLKEDRWSIWFKLTGNEIDSHVGVIEMYTRTMKLVNEKTLHYLIFSNDSELTILLNK